MIEHDDLRPGAPAFAEGTGWGTENYHNECHASDPRLTWQATASGCPAGWPGFSILGNSMKVNGGRRVASDSLPVYRLVFASA